MAQAKPPNAAQVPRNTSFVSLRVARCADSAKVDTQMLSKVKVGFPERFNISSR
jgi:hypothetical protein